MMSPQPNPPDDLPKLPQVELTPQQILYRRLLNSFKKVKDILTYAAEDSKPDFQDLMDEIVFLTKILRGIKSSDFYTHQQQIANVASSLDQVENTLNNIELAKSLSQRLKTLNSSLKQLPSDENS